MDEFLQDIERAYRVLPLDIAFLQNEADISAWISEGCISRYESSRYLAYNRRYYERLLEIEKRGDFE